ncbi:MAG: hypothetical protein Hals2KO_14610 [Halioglobus sp.]
MPKNEVNWTHSSVLDFAAGAEPVSAMEMKAKSVALHAMEQGWKGPPFDPIQLAEMLGIKVSATSEVEDARTISDGKRGLHIQYNPNRPRGRIRFSIAHELAHSFFPDCHEQVRYRQKTEPGTDEWQLEALCNIGASELVMPIGSNPEFNDDNISIQQVLTLRKEFDVSTEALLIRLSKLTEKPLAVFCASRLDDQNSKVRFRMDYVIGSKSWCYDSLASAEIESEVMEECTAIGYTVAGKQHFPGTKRPLLLECVGLPPYPGQKYPRIAGIIYARESNNDETPGIVFHEGDASKPGGTGPKIIAHIVNDRTPNWGGGGFAVALKRRYPDVQKDFRAWAQFDSENLKLGRSHFFSAKDELHTFSMVAQHGFGRSDTPRVRYGALETCLENLAHRAYKLGASIHMPRIGTGNARGDWPVIEELIDDALIRRGVEVNVYDFTPMQSRQASLL